MITERTTYTCRKCNKELTFKPIYKMHSICSYDTAQCDGDFEPVVWVLKEDVEKALNQIEKVKILLDENTEKYIEFMLKTFRKNFNINSPPDENLTSNSISTSVLKKDSEEKPEGKCESKVVMSSETSEEGLCSCHVGARLYVCRCNDEPKQRGI